MTSLLTDPDRSRTREVTYDVPLRDGTVQRVDVADAYEPERSMTTFFRTDGRPTVDCWSVRMASFRTDEILAIRRLEDVEVGAEPALRIV